MWLQHVFLFVVCILVDVCNAWVFRVYICMTCDCWCSDRHITSRRLEIFQKHPLSSVQKTLQNKPRTKSRSTKGKLIVPWWERQATAAGSSTKWIQADIDRPMVGKELVEDSLMQCVLECWNREKTSQPQAPTWAPSATGTGTAFWPYHPHRKLIDWASWASSTFKISQEPWKSPWTTSTCSTLRCQLQSPNHWRAQCQSIAI